MPIGVTKSEPETAKKPAPRAWIHGVRARLLLAFFGIAGFAVLAAAASIIAFGEVGDRLKAVDARISPTLSALELSRSAERIIAAAPALLAADRDRRDVINAALAAEAGRLTVGLADLRRADAGPPDLEAIVGALTSSLTALNELVARRLDASERLGTLRRGVFVTNAETQRLLAPWLEITDREIAALLDARAAGPPGQLLARIELQQRMQAAQAQVSAVAEMLAEASTTDGRAPPDPRLPARPGAARSGSDGRRA